MIWSDNCWLKILLHISICTVDIDCSIRVSIYSPSSCTRLHSSFLCACLQSASCLLILCYWHLNLFPIHSRPRASIVGERLWSDQSVTDVSDAGKRLHNHRCRLIRWEQSCTTTLCVTMCTCVYRRGIPAEPTEGPSFCSPEYDPIIA